MMPTEPWVGGETFYPRDQHEGSREGWVYKCGARGLGYYADGVAEKEPLDLNKALWPNEGLAPVTLKLNQLVGNPLEATTLDDTAKGKPSKKRQTKKRSRGAEGISNIDAFVDSLTTKGNDISHRSKGWWAFDGINPNALNGADNYLALSGADFAAVQETRVEEAKVKEKERSMEMRGWTMAIAPCLKGGGGGNSSGVAVACRNHVGMAESFEDSKLPASLRGRFSVKHLGAVCKGGIHFASGYLHCTVGLKHPANQEYLQAAAGVLRSLRGPWIFAADFQTHTGAA